MPIYKADDLRDNPPTPEPSIIGPGLLLHTGTMMLVGQTEAGKSVVALDIAFSLALQESLFRAIRKHHDEKQDKPYFPINKACKVLYLDSEVGPIGMHDRLKKMYALRSSGVNLEDYLTIVSGDYQPLLIHETRIDNGVSCGNFKDLIKQHQPHIVILDHLGDFHLLDEDSNLMRIILKGLRQLQQQHKFAAIVVHHESDKQMFSSGGQIIEKSGTGRQRGHSSIAQSVDTMLGIKRENKEANQTFLRLDWLKTRHCRKPSSGWLFVDLDEMRLDWFGPVNHVKPADKKAYLDRYNKEKINKYDES